MHFKLEIIGFTIEGARIAQAAGAHRIELCDNPGEGGTTPSYGFIKAARDLLNIELFPIIRPRGGDFLYTDAEFEIMKADVIVCKALGCEGVVTGLLHKNGTVDKARITQLVELAYPMRVCFHRAFDRTPDAELALEDVIETGCVRILTSGLQPTALEGVELLQTLIRKAGERIVIMPGSGVNAENIKTIASITGAKEFHASARVSVPGNMEYVNQRLGEKSDNISVDKAMVENLIIQLESI